jgi:putative membrane protein
MMFALGRLSSPGILMNPKLVTAITLIVITILFVLQNAAVVELRFLIWTVAMSRALMVFLLVIIGIGIGWLLRGHVAHKAPRKDAEEDRAA